MDADDGRDDAENSYYEEAADPGFVRLEKARRRFRGVGQEVELLRAQARAMSLVLWGSSG